MFRLAALTILAARASAEEHHAVLVAGSNSYWNYRHQADVCHAYHVLISRGFKPENIITMMFDDVAHDPHNPFPGKLYNYPWASLEEAVDVYEGCKLDYTGKDVTPDKFLAVLTGDAAAAGGKVLQSQADDHVFVNFVDHGAVGLVAFPSTVLHANQLIAALTRMYQQNMFKQLTFYLEACESGSMFLGLLPEGLPIYAVTAANAKESSWGTYCGDQATVAGKSLMSCLGDLFSVNWMEDSDRNLHNKESLLTQFLTVQHNTNKSHVLDFGSVQAIQDEDISAFMGLSDDGPDAAFGEAAPKVAVDYQLKHSSAVDSRDAKLHYLYTRYAQEGSKEAEAEMLEEMGARRQAKELAAALRADVAQTLGKELDAEGHFVEWTQELLQCHEAATKVFESTCGWTGTKLPLSKTLYQLCRETSGHEAPVVAAIRQECAPTSTLDDIWA